VRNANSNDTEDQTWLATRMNPKKTTRLRKKMRLSDKDDHTEPHGYLKGGINSDCKGPIKVLDHKQAQLTYPRSAVSAQMSVDKALSSLIYNLYFVLKKGSLAVSAILRAFSLPLPRGNDHFHILFIPQRSLII
jgi:hypothetical protein